MGASPHQRLYVDSWGHFLAVTQRVTLTYILYNKSSIKHTEFTITTKRWSCSHLCVYNPTITRVTGGFKPSKTGQVKQMFSGNQLTCRHRNNPCSVSVGQHCPPPSQTGPDRSRSSPNPLRDSPFFFEVLGSACLLSRFPVTRLCFIRQKKALLAPVVKTEGLRGASAGTGTPAAHGEMRLVARKGGRF